MLIDCINVMCFIVFIFQCCAVSFIEKLNADSLNMTEDEYNRYMSGELVPHDPNKVYTCEGIQLLKKNKETMKDLKQTQERLMGEAMQLQQDMQDFRNKFLKEISDVLERTPLVIRPPRGKTKVDIDAEEAPEVVSSLPPPLQPQRISSSSQIVPLPCQVAGTEKGAQSVDHSLSKPDNTDNLAEGASVSEDRPKDIEIKKEDSVDLMQMNTPVEDKSLVNEHNG